MSPIPVVSSSPLSMTKSELKNINRMSDTEVPSMPDEIILAAALSSWTSKVYTHFKIFVEHLTNEYGEKYIQFRFECKSDPVLQTQYRARKDTSSGTHNLIRGVEACDLVRKVNQNGEVTIREAREFSSARFRALIALWCARNHRPFELFRDDLFAAIVNELRPGTSLPDPSTISRDVRSIYHDNKETIRQYFRQIDHVHLAMDGWTAPTSRSYLGVVAIWQHSGKLHRAILEFILLTKRHTGEYLAQQTAECLNKCELGTKLLTVCMDNASNNNTFPLELQKHFPTFGGPRFRGRCSAHIVNLMAKAYLSVFSKPESQKRAVKGNEVTHTPAKHQRIASNSTNMGSAGDDEGNDTGKDSDSEGDDGPTDGINADKVDYNNITVKSSVTLAFLEVERLFGLVISPSDWQTAQQLLPKISGLANCAKRSPLVQQKFEQYVAKTSGSGCSPHPALPCSVATRWNTELICIRGHVQKHAAVKLLTADWDLLLKCYQLTDSQWELAEQLVSKLKTLDDSWLSDNEVGFEPTLASRDTLEDYLSAPLVPVEMLCQGGLLAYWDSQLKQTPQVAKFALSILSSPASLVDAERAFSGGRLTITHLQHSMGDVTFEAKMAVGSWFNTPLLPSVDNALCIVEERMRH